jgi:hypothetical protein
METYPKVQSVEALRGKSLKVTFVNGEVRIYDCNPLLSEPPFRLLENEAFFRAVRADDHGYGVVWDDEVDLAESELWLHGKTEQGLAKSCGASLRSSNHGGASR